MAKFVQYFPSFFSGFKKETFTFSTFEDLKKKLRKNLNYPDNGYEFCCGDSRTLMTITTLDNPDRRYYVIGFVGGIDLTKYLKRYDDEYYKKK